MSDNINDLSGVQIPLPKFSLVREMSASEYLKERTRMEAWSAENCNQAILDCDDECCECP